MSRRLLIQRYQPDEQGPVYGRVVKSADMMDVQDFIKRRVDLVLRDLVMRTAAAPQVEGFAHALPGGLTFRVGPGHATDLLGRSFETYPPDENTDVQIGAAPPANARIDLVYASLVADQDAEPQLLPHRRKRTLLEVEQGVQAYTEDDFNVFTERRNAAVLSVRAGAVAANPVAPAVGANEVPLYHVRVDAGDVAIAPGKVTDVRNRMRSLYQLMQNVAALEASLTQASFTEAVQDALENFFPDGAPFDWTVDDATNRVQLDIAVATAVLKGLMSAADKAALDTRTSAATASAIIQRDANADAAVRRLKASGAQIGAGYAATAPPDNGQIVQGKSGFGTSNPHSHLQGGASLALYYFFQIGDRLLDDVICAIRTQAEAVLTLPSAVGIEGRVYIVKNTHGEDITIATTGGQTIDGAANYALNAQWSYVWVMSDGANWHVISKG